MDDLEQIFKGKPVKRDMNICRKCIYFHTHDNGTFGCGNVLRGLGHPWCVESRKSLKEEYFVRASIFIANREQCLQPKDD